MAQGRRESAVFIVSSQALQKEVLVELTRIRRLLLIVYGGQVLTHVAGDVLWLCYRGRVAAVEELVVSGRGFLLGGLRLA